MDKQIGIISDIHSNAISLELALSKLIDNNIQECVILGDLLTYGTQPNECIELLLEFKNKISCTFIKGNHDQFYFDIENDINPIKYKMPEFVKESIFWTKEKLKYNLSEVFNWQESITIGKVFFSHANPFGYGNWTYMNKTDDILNAALKLNEKNINAGVFGHTHRNNNYIVNVVNKTSKSFYDNNLDLNSNKEKLILNPGSIGQPRGNKPNIMILNIGLANISFSNITIDINREIIIDMMNDTTLTLETKNKLNSFWEINND